MKPKARISISTSVFNKAYLKRAWAERGTLADYERRGFAHFFYLTISGHLESVLAEVIKARLRSIPMIIPPRDQLSQIEYTKDGERLSCSPGPLVTSLLGLLSSSEDTAEQAPFERLRELYSKIFVRSLADAIGSELNQDICAIFSLRNLFAHSRQLYVDVEPLPDHAVTLEGNPLQFPAQRLQRAGIIKSLTITPQNYLEFQKQLYSDQALMYFYHRVKEAEHKVTSCVDFLPETGTLDMHVVELPSLKVGSTDGDEQADAPPAGTS